MTEVEKNAYQKGFMVALNFLFHHHETEKDRVRSNEDKARFRKFLLTHTNSAEEAAIVERAITLKSTMEGSEDCDSGFCRVNGRCVLCKFKFAFDGTFHS